MNSVNNLTGSILVAHPTLLDPNFRKTVIFISHHQPDEGATGFVLNRPLDEKIPSGKEIPEEIGIYYGGPVQPSEFVLASLQWRSQPTVVAFRIFVDPMPEGETVGSEWLRGLRAFAGYSGWSAGQLEREIAQGAWLVIPPNREIIEMTSPHSVWKSIMRHSGPMMHLLSEAPDNPESN